MLQFLICLTRFFCSFLLVLCSNFFLIDFFNLLNKLVFKSKRMAEYLEGSGVKIYTEIDYTFKCMHMVLIFFLLQLTGKKFNLGFIISNQGVGA